MDSFVFILLGILELHWPIESFDQYFFKYFSLSSLSPHLLGLPLYVCWYAWNLTGHWGSVDFSSVFFSFCCLEWMTLYCAISNMMLSKYSNFYFSHCNFNYRTFILVLFNLSFFKLRFICCIIVFIVLILTQCFF